MKGIILFLLLVQNVFAQDGTFSISTSLDTVYLGNYVEIKFIAENLRGQFKEPSFAGLKVISGPNTFSSMTMVNGETSSSTTYSYTIKPSEVGNYIIEPAQLETEDGNIKTLEKLIVVLPNPENILQNPRHSDETPFDLYISPKKEKSKIKKKIYKI
ncbi:MAG: BatD family protein [Saprospiraceae bacterium]|nr:BatD family protein [Saprospiraceae bacterium]